MFPRSILRAVVWAFTASSSIAAPVEIIPPEFRGALQPQVAVTASGRVHVAFGKGDTIYHVASADEGKTFSKPVRVADLPKLALGMRRGPRIAATDKTIAITAISHADGLVHGWSSSDGGATWKETASINDVPKSAREGLHAMAADGKGNVFVTWLDLRNGSTELWDARSTDGGVTWGQNFLLYKSPDGHICECCHPSAAMDAEGRVAVMWRNWLGGSRDMYSVLSSDGGKTFSAAEKLGSGTWKLNACPMDGGAITFDKGGKLRGVWRREKAVFASEAAGAERRLADSAAQPVVVAGKGGAYTFWESGGDLMLKKGESSVVRFAENARFVAAAALPSGGAIVAWESPAEGKTTLRAQGIE